MPIYEYECTACGHRFERRQRIDEEPVKTCPTCSGLTRRVLHPVGIIFKGSGWYATDSRKGVNGKGEAGESAGEGKSADTKGEKAEPRKPSGESASKG